MERGAKQGFVYVSPGIIQDRKGESLDTVVFSVPPSKTECVMGCRLDRGTEVLSAT